MHKQYLNIKNRGTNEFSMQIKVRKVENASFSDKYANVSVILVFVTDKNQNGYQKGNFQKQNFET